MPRLASDANRYVLEEARPGPCFREGAEGIFYSVQAASHTFHTEEEYTRFGEPHKCPRACFPRPWPGPQP